MNRPSSTGVKLESGFKMGWEKGRGGGGATKSRNCLSFAGKPIKPLRRATKQIQWNLLGRTLSGQAILSLVERLSSFRGDFLQSVYMQEYFRLVLCWEVCPLSEYYCFSETSEGVIGLYNETIS